MDRLGSNVRSRDGGNPYQYFQKRILFRDGDSYNILKPLYQLILPSGILINMDFFEAVNIFQREGEYFSGIAGGGNQKPSAVVFLKNLR